MMPPPRRQLFPAWMFVVSPGHHFGGIHDPSEHVRRSGALRAMYQQTDAAPVFDADAVRRERGAWRDTVVRDQTIYLTGERGRPRLRHPAVPSRRVTLADRFTEWLERRLGWQAELLP